jgi:beta-galactosidase
MRVTLAAGGKTDVVEQPVGLRFYRVDPSQGFFLNGEHLALHGVNRHQDHLDEGWAITLADHQNDFALMMEMGCTAVRLSHYQHAQEFYDLCDRGGIVAWAEIPLVNRVTNSPAFDANAQQQLRELIKQSFNHPAICFWSLSNELSDGSGAGRADQEQHQQDIIGKLNGLAHQLDPTRLTTQASSRQVGQKLDTITDVIGYNRYFGWYSGSFTQWPDQLDKIHAANPDRSVALSEYGAGSSIFQHEAAVKQPKPNGSRWHPEEWECLVHEHAWDAMRTRPWIWGSFIWCLHDFAADQRNEGDHAGRNDKGMVTYDGKTKKDVFYFYKANWSDEPFVHITDSRFTPRPVADAPIKIYSNCENVELKLNGNSLGTVPGNEIHSFVWTKAQMVAGENKLEATGTRDGKSYTDNCTIVFDVNAKDGKPPAVKP